ncbi:hypothetical protein HanXRQr2_Chr11g0476011 [Helianthus annuus]|uniref:Uncharacterized protein n=1 Tax=Helianthus annuus TaxID=4232 RepID=A0A251SV55_HELAN|nr:hypothetical protein HanXRQr2_Chr11g0476011 [Helianthus annuus]KAJ0508041.1 hypothetical protein HanIR_Chr11g0512931 [Helianthus annuus]KAJ0516379.1 hypothetical protein HanHA89_Chr11g0413231 [Helianthus annuus]
MNPSALTVNPSATYSFDTAIASSSIFVSATVIWLLFERIGYHLLPLSPPKFPDITLSQEICDVIALLVMDQINQAYLYLREMTTGRDLKGFMSVCIFILVIIHNLDVLNIFLKDAKTSCGHAGHFHPVGGLSQSSVVDSSF